ncbi:SRPBCC family protein [Acuticoccus mangrovi]|uniref:SRPBCC family protein n=1 Tax=Acuticoccus mangrovi TaxID=2796142 RepID=A0A934IP95_9HYPH|nr:SRPBCC family protein [Acuticoccus mangrovi]MBJ3776225.1 SRPBCC family protein [Acuticoccus mangrovi]
MNTAQSSTDIVVESVDIAAPVARVWRALTDHREFGEWFGVVFATPFRPGETVHGSLTIADFAGLPLEITVREMDAPRRFVFSWHPYAVEPDHDYTKEPQTLIEFTLEPRDTGTRLTVRESGFDALPEARRPTAFRMNTKGWPIQLGNIARHVTSG